MALFSMMTGVRARVATEAHDLGFVGEVPGRQGLPNTVKLGDKLIGTERFDAAKQAAHEVTGVDGKVVMKADGKTLDTRKVADLDYFQRPIPTEVALLVHLPDGRLISTGEQNTGFVDHKLVGPIKHSTLGNGKPADGFEMKAKEGTVKELTNHSGHYQPDLAGFRSMLRALKAQGIDTGDAKFKIKYFPTPGAGGTRGYKDIGRPEVRSLASSYALGKYLGFKDGWHRFALGAIKEERLGTISMLQTTAGFIPGNVLRTAAAKQTGPFKQTIVHPGGDVEFRFEPKPSAYAFRPPPGPEPEPIVIAKDRLESSGLRIDEDGLPALAGRVTPIPTT